MAVVIGRGGERTDWMWIFNERAYYGDGFHGDGPAPDNAELDASRPERARLTTSEIKQCAARAGLPAPDLPQMVEALLAEELFAMNRVYDLCVLLGVRSAD
jgi:hypothetical protein